MPRHYELKSLQWHGIALRKDKLSVILKIFKAQKARTELEFIRDVLLLSNILCVLAQVF